MGASIKEYVVGLAKYWWVVFVGFLGGGLGVGIDAAQGGLDVPIWVWIAIACGGFVVAQFVSFHKVREQRDELKARIQQSTPSYIFIIEKLGVAFGLPSTLTIRVGITVTPTMSVEDVQLKLLGKSIPSDWRQRQIGGSAESHYVSFVIPDSVKSGEYNVHLVAIADGISTESKPFQITIPDR